MKKLLVLGGTGFLGSAICKRAAERGWQVVSLSRRGRPRDAHMRVYQSAAEHPWRTAHPPIQYLAYDIFLQQQQQQQQSGDASLAATGESMPRFPDHILDHVRDCTAVVHALGTLLDGDAYKKIAKSSSLLEAATQVSGCVQRILFQTGGAPPSESSGFYERMNRDSGMFPLTFRCARRKTPLHAAVAFLLLSMCARQLPELRSFLFTSATDQLLPFPLSKLLDSRYLSTKRQVEQVLQSGQTTDGQPMHFDRFVLRPGFLYSDQNLLTLPVSTCFSFMHAFKTEVLPTTLQQVLPAPPAKPLHINTVASAAVECIESALERERVDEEQQEPKDADRQTFFRLEVADMAQLS